MRSSKVDLVVVLILIVSAFGVLLYSGNQEAELRKSTIARLDAQLRPTDIVSEAPEAIIQLDSFTVFNATWQKYGKLQIYKSGQTYFFMPEGLWPYSYTPRFSILILGGRWDNP